MNKAVQEQISKEVDTWVEESEVPVRGNLKPVRMFDGLYPEGEEAEAYWDFVAWYMQLDWLPVLRIPVKDEDKWSPPIELDEHENDVSAFNTMDYRRLHGFKFDYKYFKLKETMERLYDLAQTFSCVSNEAGKAHIKAVFDEIVHFEFKVRYREIYEAMKKYPMWINRRRAVEELAKLQGNIHQAEAIWKETAYET